MSLRRLKTMREEMTEQEKAELDQMYEEIYADALADGASPENIEEFKAFRERMENLPTFEWPLEEDVMGAEQYLIVEAGGMHDADGPHEVDAAIVPEYAEIDKQNKVELEQLARTLSENYDGSYVVISNTQYWELKNA